MRIPGSGTVIERRLLRGRPGGNTRTPLPGVTSCRAGVAGYVTAHAAQWNLSGARAGLLTSGGRERG